MFAILHIIAEVSPEYANFEDDFSPLAALLFFGVLLAIICIVVAIGIVVALLAIGFAVALIAGGLIASSSIVGLASGKFSSGVKALILQICAGVGVVLGLGIAFALHWFADLGMRAYMLGIAGAISGLISGLILAFAINAVWPRVLDFLKAKVEVMHRSR